ncbi:hypothetical protein RJZ90_005603, partial [Blastomyces dermatitidis]
KIAAQCSHATLACYKHYLTRAPDSPILKRWERGGQAKVALQVKSEEELLVLQAQAVSLGLCAQVIQDAGRTQIASGSRTVLGILGPRGVVDGVTGGLKLLYGLLAAMDMTEIEYGMEADSGQKSLQASWNILRAFWIILILSSSPSKPDVPSYPSEK